MIRSKEKSIHDSTAAAITPYTGRVKSKGGAKFGNPHSTGGARPGAGRPPGAVSPHSVEIKDMMLGALAELGGKDYMMEQGRINPAAFMAIISRMLPKDINLTGLERITVNLIGPGQALPAIDVTPAPEALEHDADDPLA